MEDFDEDFDGLDKQTELIMMNSMLILHIGLLAKIRDYEL